MEEIVNKLDSQKIREYQKKNDAVSVLELLRRVVLERK